MCLSDTLAHKGGVNTVCAIPSSTPSPSQPLLLSAGKDHKARLWSGIPLTSPASNGKLASETRHGQIGLANGMGHPQQDPLQAVAVYGGHTDAVQCAAVSPAGSRLATGGWDHGLMLWPTGETISFLFRASDPAHRVHSLAHRILSLASVVHDNWSSCGSRLVAGTGLKLPPEKYFDASVMTPSGACMPLRPLHALRCIS